MLRAGNFTMRSGNGPVVEMNNTLRDYAYEWAIDRLYQDSTSALTRMRATLFGRPTEGANATFLKVINADVRQQGRNLVCSWRDRKTSGLASYILTRVDIQPLFFEAQPFANVNAEDFVPSALRTTPAGEEVEYTWQMQLGYLATVVDDVSYTPADGSPNRLAFTPEELITVGGIMAQRLNGEYTSRWDAAAIDVIGYDLGSEPPPFEEGDVADLVVRHDGITPTMITKEDRSISYAFSVPGQNHEAPRHRDLWVVFKTGGFVPHSAWSMGTRPKQTTSEEITIHVSN